MIYLIGGAPRCGKTTIAQKLAKDLKISWISADTLESIASVYIPKEKHDKFFPKDKIRAKTGKGNDRMYIEYTTKQIVDLYIKQSKASWKGIKMIAEVANLEGHDYIVEGHQVHPQLIYKIQKQYKNVKSLVLTRFNVENIVQGCRKHKAKNDWFLQKTKDPKIHYTIAEMTKKYSDFFNKEAKKYNLKILNMDKDFLNQIKRAINILKNS